MTTFTEWELIKAGHVFCYYGYSMSLSKRFVLNVVRRCTGRRFWASGLLPFRNPAINKPDYETKTTPPVEQWHGDPEEWLLIKETWHLRIMLQDQIRLRLETLMCFGFKVNWALFREIEHSNDVGPRPPHDAIWVRQQQELFWIEPRDAAKHPYIAAFLEFEFIRPQENP